jgi:23S rRNA pseudouridine2605 synthase|tara:strand:- start:1663 stop:2406 length:744 start_codon:yes stop_codon:yes gene_type:complete
MTNESKNQNQRIAKFIANSGISSRREAERMILSGRVQIDGKIITTPAVNVVTDSVVKVDGKEISTPKNLRVWLFYKPIGSLVTNNDPGNRKTIYNILPKDMQNVIAVGRLDMNSEGLILLTNNGNFSRYMELPKNSFERDYKVRVHGKINIKRLSSVEKGSKIDGIKYMPIKVSLGKTTGTNSWLTMKLNEGKNREIRKVCNFIGLEVNRLIRLSYGPFDLGDLKKEEIREVSDTFLKNNFKDHFYL